MQNRFFTSEETHRKWLDKIGILRQLNRVGAQDFSTLPEAAFVAARAEHARRYYHEADRQFLDAEVTESVASQRNGHLLHVSVAVTEEGPDLSGLPLPMTLAIYQLPHGSFVSLDQLFAGRDWSFWENRLTPGLELIQAQFKLYDLDGNGTIELKELKALLQTMDPKCWTDEKVERLLLVVDTNEDKKIQFEEFIQWIFAVNEFKDASFATAGAKWMG